VAERSGDTAFYSPAVMECSALPAQSKGLGRAKCGFIMSDSNSGRIATILDPAARWPYDDLMASGKNKKARRKAMMLGVGLDSDGHKRVTTGSNFALVGGSEETHEVMTEKVIKINEKLASRGKQLENVSSEEFDDIANSVGLHRREEK